MPLILLADDFVDACEMYAELLRFHGFEVVTALDGPSAVEAARARKPDVVLLDIRMPGLTGTEVMRVLKADAHLAGVPLVALTAHALPEERDAALRAGFDAFISKPILPDELIARINELLGSRVPPKELPIADHAPGGDRRDPAGE